MIQGVGAAATIVASTAMNSANFPAQLGAVMGLQEACVGFGFMVGAPVGAALYTLGFRVPFLATGGLCLLTSFACMLVFGLEDDRKREQHQTERLLLNCRPTVGAGGSGGVQLRRILSGNTCLALGAALLGTTTIGFIDPTLGPHLTRSVGMSAAGLGGIFAIPAGFYGLMGGVAGGLCDGRGPKPVMMLGFLVLVLAWALVGPAPFLFPLFDSSAAAWVLAVVPCVLLGSGVAFILVPALPAIMNDLPPECRRERAGATTAAAYENAVAGLFGSFAAAGEGIGPLLGGALTHAMPQTAVVHCAAVTFAGGPAGSCPIGCESGFAWGACLYSGVLAGYGLLFALVFGKGGGEGGGGRPRPRPDGLEDAYEGLAEELSFEENAPSFEAAYARRSSAADCRPSQAMSELSTKST
jgi:MFS family permease